MAETGEFSGGQSSSVELVESDEESGAQSSSSSANTSSLLNRLRCPVIRAVTYNEGRSQPMHDAENITREIG